MDSGLPGRAGGDDLARVSLRGGPGFPLQASFTQPPPVLHLAGDIDEWTYPGLTEVLAWAAAAGESRIRIDLAGVDYCDVAGLRAIVSLAGRAGNGEAAGNGQARDRVNDPDSVEQVVLDHVPEPVSSVLRILGWDAMPGVVLDG